MRNNMTYEEALNAMQSGVAFTMTLNPSETSPKHLRVGVNASMSDHGALVRLLIRKGVFTEEEYMEEVRLGMLREVKSYEEDLSELTGKEITLG